MHRWFTVPALVPALSSAAPATPANPTISVSAHCVIRGTTIGMKYQGEIAAVANPKGGGSRRMAILTPAKEDLDRQLAFDAAKLLDDYTRYGATPLAAPYDVTVITIEDVAPGRWAGYGYGNLNSKDGVNQKVDVQMMCDLADTAR